MIENESISTMSKPITKEKDWAKLHIKLQGLLAGYLDGELTEQENSIIEAHLIGCQDCRNDLERQKILVHHMKQIPIETLPIDICEKIQLDVLKENKIKEKEPKIFISLKTKIQNQIIILFKFLFSKQTLTLASGWVVAILIAYFPFSTINQVDQEVSSIPMINDALEQYEQLQNKDMPTTLIDIQTPAKWKNSRKLASWMTEIGGSPAQAFAVRYKNHVILQYKIDQTVFFRNAKVRQAIAKNGWYQDQNSVADILLLPQDNSGLIIVGPKHFLPKKELISVSSI